MKAILLIFTFFFCVHLNAQLTFPLQLIFIDNETGGINGSTELTITNGGELVFFSEDYDGKIIPLQFEDKKRQTFNLSISFESYKDIDTSLVLTPSDWNLTIFGKPKPKVFYFPLNYDGQSYDDVNIESRYEPEIVFGSDTLSVADFEMGAKGDIYLLVYEKKLKKGCYLAKLDNDELVQKTYFDPYDEIATLQKDYALDVYVIGKKKSFKIEDKEKIDLIEITKHYYEDYVLPIVDTLDNKIFFSNFNEWFPAFDYKSVNTADTTYDLLHHIEDAEMMEHYIAEYKWVDVRTQLWAWDMERDSGIDREIWVGANVFTKSIFYEPPYAPMFSNVDTLFIFDFYNEQMYKIDAVNNNKLDSLPISFHKYYRKTGWKKQMIQDPVSKDIYCVFDKGGYFTLKKVDTTTGKLGQPLKLHYRYVEKINIFDGEVHYIYRPFESIQKKYLYKEDINDLK